MDITLHITYAGSGAAFIVNENNRERNLNQNIDNDNWNSNNLFLAVCKFFHRHPAAKWGVIVYVSSIHQSYVQLRLAHVLSR